MSKVLTTRLWTSFFDICEFSTLLTIGTGRAGTNWGTIVKITRITRAICILVNFQCFVFIVAYNYVLYYRLRLLSVNRRFLYLGRWHCWHEFSYTISELLTLCWCLKVTANQSPPPRNHTKVIIPSHHIYQQILYQTSMTYSLYWKYLSIISNSRTY